MPQEPLSDRNLNQLLDEQIEALRSMVDALQTERAALTARDGEGLLEAVHRKAACIAAADVIEDRRQALIGQLGLTGRPGGMISGVSGASDGTALRWQQILALTQQCRALNEANGQFIRGQRRRTVETLRLLRGDPEQSAEYGPGGSERRSRGLPRPIASI